MRKSHNFMSVVKGTFIPQQVEGKRDDSFRRNRKSK